MVFSPGIIESLSSTELEAYLQNESRSQSEEDINKDIDFFLTKFKRILEIEDHSKRIESLLSLNVLIDSDLCNKGRLEDLLEPLKRTLLSSNSDVVKVAVTTFGKIAVALVSTSKDFFEKEITQACDALLYSEKSEHMYSSVLVLEELAKKLPSLFSQHLQHCFMAIFIAIREPKKPALREAAAAALRAFLKIAVQREAQSHVQPPYYQQCMDELEKACPQEGVRWKSDLEDWNHASLLILQELFASCDRTVQLLCSREERVLLSEPRVEAYKRDKSLLKGYTNIETLTKEKRDDDDDEDADDDEAVLRVCESRNIKKLISNNILRLTVNVLKQKHSKQARIHHCLLSILPRLSAICPRLFFFNHLDETIEYLRAEHKVKDRAQSFVCLGLVAYFMQENINKHKQTLFSLLHQQLTHKDKKGRNQMRVQSSVLSCICMLAEALFNNNNTNKNNTNINNNNNNNNSTNAATTAATGGSANVDSSFSNHGSTSVSFVSSIISSEDNNGEDNKNNNKNNNNNNNNDKNTSNAYNKKNNKNGAIVDDFIPFLDLILSLPLSPPMLKALERLTKIDDGLKRIIQINLLKKLHLILVNKELQHPYYFLGACGDGGNGGVSGGGVGGGGGGGGVAGGRALERCGSPEQGSAVKKDFTSHSFENLLSPERHTYTKDRKSLHDFHSLYTTPPSSLPSAHHSKAFQSGPSTPFSTIPSLRNSLPRRISMLKQSPSPVSISYDQVALALKALGDFDLEGFSLSRWVEYLVDVFLRCEYKQVRINTAVAATKILANNYLAKLQHNQMDNLVCSILFKILSAAVVDEDADIRFSFLSCLQAPFDSCLCHQQCLALLSSCVHDDDVDVREMAVCQVSRLSLSNPSFVLPFLRKIILRILTELDYSGQDSNKVYSCQLIIHLARCAPSLVRTYARPIVDVVLAMLKEHVEASNHVTVCLLQVLGSVAQVTGPSFVRMSDIIIPIIISILQHPQQSTLKKRVALQTLSELVGGLCYPIEPYLKYPQLLHVLIAFFKTDTPWSIKKEALRALGTLGALDPFKLKGISNQPSEDPGTTISKTTNDPKNTEISSNELLVTMGGCNLTEFYPAVAVSTLIRMLKEPSLASHHTSVVSAISCIFKDLGFRGLDFLVKVLPLYCDLIKTSADVEFKKLLLSNMAVVVRVMKQYIKSYLPDIFILIHSLWQTDSGLTAPIIRLLESIVSSMECEFRKYLPHFVPLFMKTFKQEESSPTKPNSLALMEAMQSFGTHLDDYIHFLINPIINIINHSSNHNAVRKTALVTIYKLSKKMDLSDFAPRILITVKKVMEETREMHEECDNLLVAMSTLPQKSPALSDFVRDCFSRQPSVPNTHNVVQKIDYSSNIAEEEADTDNRQECSSPSESVLALDPEALKKASRWERGDDWLDWLRRLTMELIKQSPSSSIRTLHPLANSYNPLAKELFNAAFVSCWTELNDKEKEEVARNMSTAMQRSDSLEVTQCMLNLSEFIEHCENCSLPLDLSQLSDSALKCRAYAKALHFKEVEFRNNPTNEILESLLSINNKLQQFEAAQGVLEFAKKQSRSDLKIQERWYEKLHDWSRALASYEKQQEKSPNNVNFMLARMRCLEALGEWGKLRDIAVEAWSCQEKGVQESMAKMCATAALGLGDWSSLPEYVRMIPENTYDSSFYKGVINIYSGNYFLARKAIEQARDLLIAEMTTLSGEGYNRAYEVMVNVQMLIELQEVMEYKLLPEKRESIKELWWARLKGCQNILEDWQRFLQIRTMVMQPAEDPRPWLKYASLCRKNNRGALAARTLAMLLGSDLKKLTDQQLLTCDRNVMYAFLKHSWSDVKKREDTFKRLDTFLNQVTPVVYDYDNPPHDPFYSKCYHRLGLWHSSFNKGSYKDYFKNAIFFNKDSMKAWHSFAYANYEMVFSLKQTKATGDAQRVLDNQIFVHSETSVYGYIHSIRHAHNHSQTLQDTLRLLTLWFEYGESGTINKLVSEGFESIAVENWIQVIPQLLARIDIKKPQIANLIKVLLIRVARSHPQALIYPLTVALKSGVKSRSDAALVVINSMKELYNTTVQQASVISEELIRVAILWPELWHEGLEEASRLYFGDNNIPGMWATLEPLHAILINGPKTHKETSFVQSYGADLKAAYDCCFRFNQTNDSKELAQAWAIYYQVFRRITKQLPQLTALQLKYVSPKLLECEDLDVTVPGTYLPNQPQIKIAKVYNDVSVITSKQRPRKITMRGSDGNEFQFLLKGHEDLRQDERVMQLFGLINSILLAHPSKPRRNLSIQRYSVIPLSTNIGLIGWVPNCDTLHSLIRDYRDKKKILINIEHRIMLRVFQDYERLMLMQKVELFEHALESTKGDDLAQILWNKSASSEVWFDRRTNYTRSLAVMSVVGYILGLGDRHPSNLMLDRLTGKIMHIDFGDCFEVAMHREKFPEKIPFRLTRLLINAMEVTGIDGNYRITCENVMEILRTHKDSLMAVLEAFIYDPLLNWKLLDTVASKKTSDSESSYILEPTLEPRMLYSTYSNNSSNNNSNNNNNTEDTQPEEINKKVLLVLNRVKHKLTGMDFDNVESVDVPTQIRMLIDQATRHEHLCQCYIGWCPFW